MSSLKDTKGIRQVLELLAENEHKTWASWMEWLVTFKGVVSKDIVLVEVMKRITDRIKELKSKAKETQL